MEGGRGESFVLILMHCISTCMCAFFIPGPLFLLSGPSLTMTKNSDTRVTRGP